MMKTRFSCLTLLVVSVICSTASAQLLNPGFESPDASGGDVEGTADWSTFGEPGRVFTTATMARTGEQSLKMFGPFDFDGSGVGVTQRLPAGPGETWTGNIWALHNSAEPITSNDFGVYKIEFLDGDGLLADCGGGAGVAFDGCNVFESNRIDESTPLDVWTELGVGTAPSPATTASAQAVAVKVQLDPIGGGSIFWDDATLVPEPSSFALLGLSGLAMLLIRRKR